MASALNILANAYNSDNSDEEHDDDDKKETQHDEKSDSFDKPIDPSLSIVSSISVNAAPLVLYSVSLNTSKHSLNIF